MQKFYSCRNMNGGAPTIVARTKAAADATAIIDGAPVVATAAGDVARAALTANIVTSTAILGFSNEDDTGNPGGLLGREYALPPSIKDRDTSLKLYNVNMAVPWNAHTYPLKAGQTPARTDIGVACDIGYDATNDSWFLDKTSATNALVRITDIPSGNIGVDGGLVEFVVLDAKSMAMGGDVAI